MKSQGIVRIYVVRCGFTVYCSNLKRLDIQRMCSVRVLALTTRSSERSCDVSALVTVASLLKHLGPQLVFLRRLKNERKDRV
jgi:hypothetical protein